MSHKYRKHIRKIQLRHLFFGTAAALIYNKISERGKTGAEFCSSGVPCACQRRQQNAHRHAEGSGNGKNGRAELLDTHSGRPPMYQRTPSIPRKALYAPKNTFIRREAPYATNTRKVPYATKNLNASKSPLRPEKRQCDQHHDAPPGHIPAPGGHHGREVFAQFEVAQEQQPQRSSHGMPGDAPNVMLRTPVETRIVIGKEKGQQRDQTHHGLQPGIPACQRQAVGASAKSPHSTPASTARRATASAAIRTEPAVCHDTPHEPSSTCRNRPKPHSPRRQTT